MHDSELARFLRAGMPSLRRVGAVQPLDHPVLADMIPLLWPVEAAPTVGMENSSFVFGDGSFVAQVGAGECATSLEVVNRLRVAPWALMHRTSRLM